jgi:hypothetical protein
MDEILQAKSISCELCEHSSGVDVCLHDVDGEIFAMAHVPASSGKEFLAQFRACLKATGTVASAPSAWVQ